MDPISFPENVFSGGVCFRQQDGICRSDFVNPLIGILIYAKRARKH